MSKKRQLVVDKLKEMRVSGEPVWVTIGEDRCLIRPVKAEDHLGGFNVVLKNRGRIKTVWLSDKDGLKTFPHTGPTFHVNPKNILAIVVESHRRARV